MAKPNGADDIDEKILSKIPGLDLDNGDDDEQDTEDTAEGEEEESSESGDEESSTDSTNQSSATTGKQTEQVKSTDAAATGKQPQEQLADPLKPTGPVTVDKKGNLVNQQGHIVARAGSERRLFEKSTRLETQLKQEKSAREQDRQMLHRAAQEIKGMREVQGMAENLRMTTREAMMGLNLVDKFKKDPQDFFKYVLTQMAAIGQDVTKFLPEAGAAAVSPEGIKQLIQNELRGALGPVRETREAEQQQQRAIQDAEREYTAFVDRFPDVTTHEDVIARLIQDDANLSLDAAYYKLQSFAAQNQLDFSRPLKPQIEERQRSGKTQNAQRTQQRPMPNGRGAAPVVTKQAVHSADSSWDDLIRTTMRENGIAR